MELAETQAGAQGITHLLSPRDLQLLAKADCERLVGGDRDQADADISDPEAAP